MSIDKKKLLTTDNLVIVLAIGLLVAWIPLMNKMGWNRPAPVPAPLPVAATATTAVTTAATVVTAVAAPAVPVAAAAVSVATGLPVTGETVTLATPEFTAAIDWKNGLISAVSLLKHKLEDRRTPVVLESTGQPLAWLHTASGTLGGAARLVSSSAERVVAERELPGQNLVVRQEWAVATGIPYKLDCKITLLNRGATPVLVTDWLLDGGSVTPLLEELKGGFGMPATDAVDVAFADADRSTPYQAAEIRKIAVDPARSGAMAARPVRWSAVHSKYFVLFVGSGGKELAGITMRATEMPASADGKIPKHDRLATTLMLTPLTVAPGMAQTLNFAVYAGPKEYTLLRKLDGGVESILQMDMFMFPSWHVQWMGKIARYILHVMIWVKASVGPVWAYGLAIILITLIVKLLFWPLTHFSTVSMKRMSSLQPLVKDINEKYKDNAQLKQQKIMELYREHKVNPLMGCLPVLLQIPVFFALYNVFRCSIELRHANFLWVHDLSQPDTLAFLPYADVVPVRPLAILTIVTMFLQQKLTPSSMDPMQAKMMMFMTLFFGFIFYSMPSGLTLYWTVNQAIGIVQTIITYKLVKDLHLPHLPQHHAKPA